MAHTAPVHQERHQDEDSHGTNIPRRISYVIAGLFRPRLVFLNIRELLDEVSSMSVERSGGQISLTCSDFPASSVAGDLDTCCKPDCLATHVVATGLWATSSPRLLILVAELMQR